MDFLRRNLYSNVLEDTYKRTNLTIKDKLLIKSLKTGVGREVRGEVIYGEDSTMERKETKCFLYYGITTT